MPTARPRRLITDAEVTALVAALRAELRGFDVRYKDESRLQQAIGRLVRPFNRDYLTVYTTVMFGKVYFPSRAWCAARGPECVYEILRHEAVHLRDAQRWPVLFELSYLFLLPAGLTMRAWWEWRAYAESLRVHAELHGEIPDWRLAGIVDRFTGADYLYMWPFPKMLWRALRRLREAILAEAEVHPPED